MLTLSLIIPAYNEQRHMKACLDAVAQQTVMPDEVIVVDNNSTDNTALIAQSYPFARVVNESRQGLIYARNTGFAEATSDIYGRIDADSQIASDWVARVKSQFSVDADLAAVTGYGLTEMLPYIPRPKIKIMSIAYFWYIQASMGLQVLWGANMAVRAKDIDEVIDELSVDDNEVHEDQDITIELLAGDKKVLLDKKLLITTSGQAYRYLPKLLHYRRLHMRTKQRHKQKGTLKKAQKYRVSLMSMPVKILAIIPISAYAWTAIILLFPLDYSLRRIMRGK